MLALWSMAAFGAAAQTDDPDDPTETGDDSVTDAQAELLQQGAQVYEQICSACHQPGGVGLAGQFPPLIDNPHVDDADYVADVIVNGRQGEITVGDETYDGVMPSFSTLSDDDIDAVIAYIQNDFEAPGGVAPSQSGPVAGSELPGLAATTASIAYLLAALLALAVLYPRLVSRHSRLHVPWLDVGLKVAAIVSAVVLLMVYLPNFVLNLGVVASADRTVQDLVGTGVWALGMAVLFAGLRRAYRENRI